MPLWTKTDSAAGAPKWKSIATGSGTANRGNTLFANVTSGSFINNQSIGVFGANTVEAVAFPGNGTPGWIKTTVGTGPALTVTVTGGTTFVNGCTLTLSNGTSTATAVITSNGGGNAASATIIAPGGSGFVNNATVVKTFNRERFANTIANSTGGVAAGSFPGVTQLGFVNGNIVTITGGVLAIANSTGGNGTSAFFITGAVGYVNSNIITISGPSLVVNAVANISSTNATGGNVALTFLNRGSLVNGTVNQAFTYTISNTGLGGGVLGNTSVSIFANSIVQTVLVPAIMNISSTNATGGNIQLSVQLGGGVFSNTAANAPFTYTITQGTGLTLGNTNTSMFTNTIIAGNSGGGTIGTVTLGGRAGRINREPLVVFRGMTGTGSSSP
jgi:hypothetical protein